MSRTSRIVLAASLSLLPTALSAQTCMGSASFANRRVQIDADASFSTGARSATGGLSLGAPKGPFASLAFGAAHDDDLADNARLFAATAGFAAPLWRVPKIALCPFISVVALSDAQLPSGEPLSSQVYGFGLSFGANLSSAAGFDVVPVASAALISQSTTIHALSPELTLVEMDHHYAVSLGAGLVFGQAIAIRPSTTFTFVEGRTTRSYGVHFAFGVGPAPRPATASEGEGSQTIVWADTRAGIYYCPGSRWYGGTAFGSFMTEREALDTGARPEFGRRC